MNSLLQKHRRQEKGFTLIELLVVIVILGIISAVVVFSVGGVTDRGEAASLKAGMQTTATASEAYFAQCGRYAPTVDELVNPSPAVCPPATAATGDGFMREPFDYLTPWVLGSGDNNWAPFKDALITYTPNADPLKPAIVSYVGPDGATGSSDGTGGTGGGTTTTTTTTLPGACALVSGSPNVVNLQTANTTEPSFTVVTSGTCTSISIGLDKNLSNGESNNPPTFTLTGPTSPWTGTALPAGGWSNNGTSSYQNVEVFNGTTLLGTFNLTVVDTATTCALVSGSPSSVTMTNGTNNLTADPAFTFTTTGTCTGLSLDLDPGTGPNKTITMTQSPANSGNWIESPSQSQQNGGWSTGGADSATTDVHVVQGGNNIGEWILTINNPVTVCTYAGGNNGSDTPDVTLGTGGGLSGGPYSFRFDTRGPCTGTMRMAIAGQPTLTGFTAGSPVGGVTSWTLSVSGNTFTPWVAASNRVASVTMNNTTISGGADVGNLDVLTPVCDVTGITVGLISGGDWQVPRNGSTGNLDSGGVTIGFTTVNTAFCPATLNFIVDVPGTGTDKSVSVSKPGSGDSWSKSIPTGSSGDSAGWGPTANDQNRATDIAVANGATNLFTTTIDADFI